MESHLPPESKVVHIIEIGCVKNCHKAWKNMAKIGLFVAFSRGILKKLKRSNSRPKIISVELNEYLLSLLRSWEASKNSFFRQKINCFVAVQYATDFNKMHHSELRKYRALDTECFSGIFKNSNFSFHLLLCDFLVFRGVVLSQNCCVDKGHTRCKDGPHF